MSDLTDRLRRWAISTDAVPASDLMDEAADEIDRLRLTDTEREAVEYFSKWCIGPSRRLDRYGATLRSLLERVG